MAGGVHGPEAFLPRAGGAERIRHRHQPVRIRTLVPLPLTIEVTAPIVAVPLGLTRPVMLRKPSVAGAQGSPVAGLFPVGEPETV
ncbi:MAG TPA: hypothetical protein VG412_03530 [Acidimicrobiales bacterium]|nr:hypothetical protein [Acidimicrobiales bacterium]